MFLVLFLYVLVIPIRAAD